PELWEPGAARHRLAARQGSVRRGARCGTGGTWRVPRPPRCDRAARTPRDRRTVRQSVRDVRAHHRRESVRGADADLPRPALHHGRAVGGLHLMTTIDGLYAIGEANFSDHGANRLGASALMQGLADGYFILPYTIGD